MDDNTIETIFDKLHGKTRILGLKIDNFYRVYFGIIGTDILTVSDGDSIEEAYWASWKMYRQKKRVNTSWKT